MAGLYPGVCEAAGDQSGEDGVAGARPRVSPALTRGGDPGPSVEHRPSRGAQQRGQVEHLVHHHVLSVHQLKWFMFYKNEWNDIIYCEIPVSTWFDSVTFGAGRT